jgi:hypothetical protein
VEEVRPETIKTKRLAGGDRARVEAKALIGHFKLEGELTMLRFVLPMPGFGAVNGRSPFRPISLTGGPVVGDEAPDGPQTKVVNR